MDTLVLRLGLALAIGLLVGLERGWRERDAPDRSRTAGIRTYGISGLLGGTFAAVADAMQAGAILAVGFLGFAAVFTWFKAREALHDEDYSVTGVIAGLAVFGLGALAVSGDYRAAAAGGAALAAVLASREVLHELLKRLTWIELRSALILAVMTAVVLPLRPDRTIDPWNGLNPWEIWFFTVLTAAISFTGYVATRLLGPARGLLASGLAGAIVSSTAVTVAFARIARSAGNARPLAGVAALAATVSILRVGVIVSLLEPRVLWSLAPAFSGALVFAIAGALLLLRDGDQTETAPARNPFELWPLLAFAALFAFVSTASAALSQYMGDRGLLATAAVSGSFDVDVAVLSALRLARQAVSLDVVRLAVLVALATNAFGRLALAILAGPAAYWAPLAVATTLAVGAGFGVFLIEPAGWR